MTKPIVLENVPIPTRSGGKPAEGLPADLAALEVDQVLLLPGMSSRKTGTTVARVSKATGFKFTSRKVGIISDSGSHKVADINAPGAIPGLGIWRTE